MNDIIGNLKLKKVRRASLTKILQELSPPPPGQLVLNDAENDQGKSPHGSKKFDISCS